MLTEYKQILMNSSTTAKTKTDIEALKVLVKLGEPNRQLFADFFNSKDKKNPAVYIREYLSEQCASPMGARMGDQIKEVVLRNARPNYHKSAMLGAVGQAYFDLCLVVSLSQYCRPDTGEDLPYSEYLAIAEKSLDSLFSTIEELTAVMNKIGIDWYKGDLKEVIQIANNESFTKELVLTRIQTAFQILKLWEDNNVKYNETYESISNKVRELICVNEDEIFFAHVVTVLKNKNSFTDKQISHVNDVYMNRFTDEQQEYYKANIPAETPTIAETQAFFFKTKNTEESILNIL